MATVNGISKSTGEIVKTDLPHSRAMTLLKLMGRASVVAQYYHAQRLPIPGAEIWELRKQGAGRGGRYLVTVFGDVPDTYSPLKVAELRGLCAKRGIETKAGKKNLVKAQLVSKLMAYDREKFTESQAAEGVDIRWFDGCAYSDVLEVNGRIKPCPAAKYEGADKHHIAVASKSGRFGLLRWIAIQEPEAIKVIEKARLDSHKDLWLARRYDPFDYKPPKSIEELVTLANEPPEAQAKTEAVNEAVRAHNKEQAKAEALGENKAKATRKPPKVRASKPKPKSVSKKGAPVPVADLVAPPEMDEETFVPPPEVLEIAMEEIVLP